MKYVLLFLLAGSVALAAQTPQNRYTWEDRSGTTGHTLVVGGKTFGPYKDVLQPWFSSGASAVGFTVAKRDKTWVVAGGSEWGPLPAGYEVGSLSVADDGQFWSLTATKYDDNGEDYQEQTLLVVGGKTYGPYDQVIALEFSEKGGIWLAAVQDGEDQKVLVRGKETAAYASVDHLWVSLDGTQWGYSVSDNDGVQTVVTQDKTWNAVADADFDMMYPREPHWGYSLRLDDDTLLIVVDGKTYSGYLHFGGLVVPPSGRAWGFEAEKMTDSGDYPVVVVNGREYVGEGLYQVRTGSTENFYWTVRDGSKLTLQALPVN